MIQKNALIQGRVRKINESFAWLPHRFLRSGFWASLSHHELLLYFFLVLVSDRQGLSYYSFDKVCSLLAITPDEYIPARNALISKDLIAFDVHLFQVLSLPEQVVNKQLPPIAVDEMEQRDPATVYQLIQRSLSDEEG